VASLNKPGIHEREPMANESKTMSAAGWASLRAREHASLRYYNDVANNCTWGVGTLAHYGPCSADEMKRPVTVAQVNSQLATREQEAEATVRRNVKDHDLTQDQFDALVSYTYNAGMGGAHPALAAANKGSLAEVAKHINATVYIYPRDANGRRLRPRKVQGLVTRRQEESTPFANQPAGTQARRP
jgi:lysozyme